MTEPAEKLEALRRFTNHLCPAAGKRCGLRTKRSSKPRVLALPLEEASAKVRSGPPIDDEDDYGWPVWAGVVPLRASIGEPIDDSSVPAAMPTFDITRLTRASRSSVRLQSFTLTYSSRPRLNSSAFSSMPAASALASSIPF